MNDHRTPASGGTDETVGFIGLGLMGKPMATNLIRAGYQLLVHNRSTGPVDDLVAIGAEARETPAAVARDASIVITMLPDTPDVEKVVSSSDGLYSGMNAGSIHLDMSTISPDLTRKLAAEMITKGIWVVDAPVSGGTRGAADGTLTIMAGGEVEAVEAVRPILAVLGGRTTHIGGPGAGQIAKSANQMIVGTTIAAVAEALLFVQILGVDPLVAREALLGGFAQSAVLQAHGERMISGSYDPGFRAEHHRKDLRIALESARESGAPMFMTAMVDQLFGALLAQGGGGRDHSALASVYESMATPYAATTVAASQ